MSSMRALVVVVNLCVLAGCQSGPSLSSIEVKRRADAAFQQLMEEEGRGTSPPATDPIITSTAIPDSKETERRIQET